MNVESLIVREQKKITPRLMSDSVECRSVEIIDLTVIMTSWPAHMVSSEIWLSLAKLVHCNEGAGGNRGGTRDICTPPDFGRIKGQ